MCNFVRVNFTERERECEATMIHRYIQRKEKDFKQKIERQREKDLQRDSIKKSTVYQLKK